MRGDASLTVTVGGIETDPGLVDAVLAETGRAAVTVALLPQGPLPDGLRSGLVDDLDEATRDHVFRFRRIEDQDRSLVAHALVRRWLAPSLGMAARRIAVVRRCGSCGGADHGAPRLDPSMESPLRFSLSHSGRSVAVAIATTKVGVDVQDRQPLVTWKEVRADAFRDREWAEALTTTDPEGALTEVWSQKEAALKAWGDGLALPMDQVTIRRSDRSRQGSVDFIATCAPDHVVRADLDGWSMTVAGQALAVATAAR